MDYLHLAKNKTIVLIVGEKPEILKYLSASDDYLQSTEHRRSMPYEGWPNLEEQCLLCGAPQCAIYRGYYTRFLFCTELEFTGRIVLRVAFCKRQQIKYVLLPDFVIPRRRISRLSLNLLHEKRRVYPTRLRDALDEMLEGLDDEFYLPLSTAYVYLKLTSLAPP